MTQETGREDPRQVPPKQFANEQPGSQKHTTTPNTGGMRDDVDEARGANDESHSGKEAGKASGPGGNPGDPSNKAAAGQKPKGPDADSRAGSSGGSKSGGSDDKR